MREVILKVCPKCLELKSKECKECSVCKVPLQNVYGRETEEVKGEKDNLQFLQ